ncbi:TonB-dependent receptor plug domain-containing protein [Hirschia maritima]|uniref:TonB-dependent receptor plug domain-containing protein n=1 Tax=Hirschia maritima TaxID=1121961 RepID=UPI00035F9371|nr:TonB-dependent receptor [Hirschia maritima]
MKYIKPDFKAIATEIQEEKKLNSSASLKKAIAAAAVTTPAAIVMTGAAEAQSIDYGSLEMLFGEPVTTSATGAPQRSTEAPVTMEIISADEIKSSGARNLSSLLSRVSGVNVQEIGSGSSDVAVRGYNQTMSPRLLVLVNGRQVYQDFYGLTQWDSIPVQLEEIRQIEVVKGPNTALFGFNAVGGVVNIITFNPLYDDADTVSVSVDNEGGNQASAVVSFKPHEKMGVRLSAGGYTKDEYSNVTRDPRGPGAENTRMAYVGEVRVQATQKTQATFEATYSENSLFERYPVTEYHEDNFENTSYRGSVESEDLFGLFKATLYRNEVTLESPATATVNPFDVEADLTTFMAENLFKVGTKNTFRVAGEYRKSAMSTNVGPLAFDVEYTVLSASGMWNWSVSDAVSTTLALRADKMEYEGDSLGNAYFGAPNIDGDTTEFSYNAGLVWSVTDQDTVRFQVARGVQTPSLIEFWLNPAIESGYVQNYGVDYDRPLEATNGSFRASVFHQVNEDIHSTYNRGIMPGLELANAQTFGESKMSGFELAVSGLVSDRFDWDASYTYLSVEDELIQGVHFGGLLTNTVLDYENSTPEHELKFNGKYTIGDWQIGANARYVSDIQTLWTQDAGAVQYEFFDIDAHVAMDAHVSYKMTDKARLTFSADNITNDGEIEVPGGGMETRYRVGLSVDF